MICSRLLRSLFVLAGFFAAGDAALAQSPICQRYRAELASLERGGGRQASVAVERQRYEIGRMLNYYRSIGCERGPFSFFGGPAPPECGAIAQRIHQMEANLARLAAQADTYGGDTEARRQQLLAAIEQVCSQDAAAPRGGFFENLFGPPRQRLEEPDRRFDEEPSEPRGLGGRRLVCVRSCDGYFFPLSNAPGGRENADEMCRALCPGAETAAFSMPNGDDALERAVSLGGKPYVQLPTAFKYQKSFDPTCSCKKPGESWAQILKKAESMLDQRRGDILVTAQKAEELSRPKPTAAQAREKDKQAASKKAEEQAEAETQAAADAGAAAPTASRESAGIGPRSIENGRIVARGEGPTREVTDANGGKRTIRMVAPNVIPVPETRTQ